MESSVKSYTQHGKRFTKGIQKVFSTIVKDISQELPTLGESGSEVSHFIPEPKKLC